MADPASSGVIRKAEAHTRVPGPAGEHAISVLRRGTLDVKFAIRPAVPPVLDSPHTQDEVYVIVRGRGVLYHDGRRDAFDTGDLLYVAAGVPHRFEDYTPDLTVWVVFYGPHGGELPA